MTTIPIMPFIVLILLVLPIKLDQKQLMKLAFFLWLVGGLVLTITGFNALRDPSVTMEPVMLALSIAAALAVGFGKGKFILSKTSQRNIDRISQLTEPQRPIHVYSVRSWVVIALMILISLSLTWFGAPMFWRGIIRLAVGFGLIMSSLSYLQAPRLVENKG